MAAGAQFASAGPASGARGVGGAGGVAASEQDPSSSSFPSPFPSTITAPCTINGWASVLQLVPYSTHAPQQTVVSGPGSAVEAVRAGVTPLEAASSASSSAGGVPARALPFRLLMHALDNSRLDILRLRLAAERDAIRRGLPSPFGLLNPTSSSPPHTVSPFAPDAPRVLHITHVGKTGVVTRRVALLPSSPAAASGRNSPGPSSPPASPPVDVAGGLFGPVQQQVGPVGHPHVAPVSLPSSALSPFRSPYDSGAPSTEPNVSPSVRGPVRAPQLQQQQQQQPQQGSASPPSGYAGRHPAPSPASPAAAGGASTLYPAPSPLRSGASSALAGAAGAALSPRQGLGVSRTLSARQMQTVAFATAAAVSAAAAATASPSQQSIGRPSAGAGASSPSPPPSSRGTDGDGPFSSASALSSRTLTDQSGATEAGGSTATTVVAEADGMRVRRNVGGSAPARRGPRPEARASVSSAVAAAIPRPPSALDDAEDDEADPFEDSAQTATTSFTATTASSLSTAGTGVGENHNLAGSTATAGRSAPGGLSSVGGGAALQVSRGSRGSAVAVAAAHAVAPRGLGQSSSPFSTSPSLASSPSSAPLYRRMGAVGGAAPPASFSSSSSSSSGPTAPSPSLLTPLPTSQSPVPSSGAPSLLRGFYAMSSQAQPQPQPQPFPPSSDGAGLAWAPWTGAVGLGGVLPPIGGATIPGSSHLPASTASLSLRTRATLSSSASLATTSPGRGIAVGNPWEPPSAAAAAAAAAAASSARSLYEGYYRPKGDATGPGLETGGSVQSFGQWRGPGGGVGGVGGGGGVNNNAGRSGGTGSGGFGSGRAGRDSEAFAADPTALDEWRRGYGSAYAAASSFTLGAGTASSSSSGAGHAAGGTPDAEGPSASSPRVLSGRPTGAGSTSPRSARMRGRRHAAGGGALGPPGPPSEMDTTVSTTTTTSSLSSSVEASAVWLAGAASRPADMQAASSGT
jgi:hypothetical protein